MQLSEHLQNLFSANADINTKIIIMQSTSLSSSAEARSKLQASYKKGKWKCYCQMKTMKPIIAKRRKKYDRLLQHHFLGCNFAGEGGYYVASKSTMNFIVDSNTVRYVLCTQSHTPTGYEGTKKRCLWTPSKAVIFLANRQIRKYAKEQVRTILLRWCI